jgi:membrane protease YdiL (CAAX protease family)
VPVARGSAVASFFAQTRALALLMWRYWRRGALPSPRVDGAARRRSGFVLRVLFLFVFVHVGYRAGAQCAQLQGDAAERAVQWLLLGLAGWSAIVGFVGGGVAVRGIQGPLYAAWLDALPLRESSRLAVAIFQSPGAQVLSVGALLGALHMPLGGGLPRALALGLAWSTVSVLFGTACVRLLRTMVSPSGVMRAATFLVPMQLLFFVVLYSAPSLAQWVNGAWLVGALQPFAKGLLETAAWLPGSPSLAAATLLSAGAIGAAERIGYDHVDVIPNRRPRPVAARLLTLRDVERVLVAREPQRTLVWFSFAYCALITAATLYLPLARSAAPSPPPPNAPEGIPAVGAICVATFLAYGAMAARASRLAARDLIARPMLAPLPVLPSELLRGKAEGIRRQGIFVASPILALIALPGTAADHATVAWRIAAAFAGLWLTAEGTVAVAFLTKGLGSEQTRVTTMTTFGLEGFLLLLPLMGVATAPYAWGAAVSLACVGLVSFEARRAALGCIRWLDDGDAFEHETPVWRALLVFTAFQAAQSLVSRVLLVSPLAPSTAEAVGYVVSAGALVALTLQGRRDLPPLEVWGRPALLVVGVFAGLASGALALTYGHWLEHLGIDFATTGATSTALPFAAATLVAAPVAEETFFRGWLQPAVHQQDPRRRRWVAIGIAAFAFAAVHPPLAFVPVLFLGLLTGGLFFASGGIAAGVLAHAAHNLVVLVGGTGG